MSQLLINTVLFFVCFLSFALQALEFEVSYENDYISVAKVTLAPHEEVGLHRDANPHLVVALKGGTVTRLEADGRTDDVLFPTGVPVMRNADPKEELHRTINPSDESVELMVVQFKKADDVSTKLSSAANAYLHFINRLSKGEDFDQFDTARSLLSPDCKKIFNGCLLTSGSDQFVQDLLEFYNTHGSWTIQPVDLIISPTSNTAVLRLFVDMGTLDKETFGKFTEILILRFDQKLLVNEINIVFNKVEEGYPVSKK